MAKLFFSSISRLFRSQLTLHCPFCGAPEASRVDGTDESGNPVVLLMFDCPFFFRAPTDSLNGDREIQAYLDSWREREGDQWLESIGPILKERELKNIERAAS